MSSSRRPFKVFEDASSKPSSKKKTSVTNKPAQTDLTRITDQQEWFKEDTKAAAAALLSLQATREELAEVSEEHQEVSIANTNLQSEVSTVWETKEDREREVEALTDKAKKVYALTKTLEDQMEVVV